MKQITTDSLNLYQKCPKFYRLDSNSKVVSDVVTTVIQECYQRTANFQRVVDWRTIRGIATAAALNSGTNIYNKTITVLNSVRDWYLKHYRDMDQEVICSLKLQYSYGDTELTAHVAALLVKNNKVTLVEFTNLEPSDYLKTVGFRTKLWLLSREKIAVNKILLIKTGAAESCHVTTLAAKKEWVSEGENLSLFYLFGIANNLFPPSPTEACNTCKFKMVCTW